MESSRFTVGSPDPDVSPVFLSHALTASHVLWHVPVYLNRRYIQAPAYSHLFVQQILLEHEVHCKVLRRHLSARWGLVVVCCPE